MKINSTQIIKDLASRKDIQEKQAQEKKVIGVKKEKLEAGASYEPSKLEDNTHVYNRLSIEKLKKESEDVYQSLKDMVEKMLTQQGKTFQQLRPGDSVKIDEASRMEAKKLIGEDGPLGVEAMSDKIVDFAKGISGGDKGKLKTLVGAIGKGFKEAERILGGLPDISRKTYDRIMEKLDIWEKE